MNISIKRKNILIAFLSICILAGLTSIIFSTANLVFAAETDSSVQEQSSSTTEVVETPVANFNNKVKDILNLIFETTGIGLDTLLIALISKRDKKPVSVTVNDSKTQDKLEQMEIANNNLKTIVIDMFKLNRGTLDILKALFAENDSITEKTKDVIKSIAVNADDITKDIDDICTAESTKKVKTAMNQISNIMVG